MQRVDAVEGLLADCPRFHSSETEIDRAFDRRESLLSDDAAKQLTSHELTCYGIGDDVLRFLSDSVGEGSKTLETGAGCSTLVFAIRKATHIAITPSVDEVQRIREYAHLHGIQLDTVEFIAQPSEVGLPNCNVADLDLVLLDGKHAFPWPIVDWFFSADKLRRGGLMLLDDAEMRSVSILVEFMTVDPGWKLLRNFEGKTLAFEKLRDKALDVAWHMQPWTVTPNRAEQPSVLRRVVRRLRRHLATK